jgi:DtxR family Mn-dependent transcriptional regulator
MRKHRLAERLLADVIGLEWEFVHEEACRWEHVMSEQVERKIIGLISSPDVSPYGNPIPGLAELGHKSNEAFRDGVIALTHLVGEAEGKKYTLSRIGEPLQVLREQLADMREAGLVPGASVTLDFGPSTITVRAEGANHSMVFSRDLATHLFVAA